MHIPNGLMLQLLILLHTSTATIDSLRRMFATHGIPESIASDNATVFTYQ